VTPVGGGAGAPLDDVVGTSAAAAASLAADVRHYLLQTPRQLPSRALYDALGSALFDAICHLPWYPVTRAERRLLTRERTAIFTAARRPRRVIELGCGNGEKLDVLLGADAAGTAVQRVDLVDVSPAALQSASARLQQQRRLHVATHQARYEDGLFSAAATRLRDERFLVLFLGSNIGNFDPPGAGAFLRTIRGVLQPGDALLIGADLKKEAAAMLLAYDDPLGVTAAFNRNLLVRLNRDLGANFELSTFAHRAVWNDAASRMEMHLVSQIRQSVAVPASGVSLTLDAGEFIWTESSYKYEVESFEATLRAASFSPRDRWIDREGRFLLVLATID
jgi:dimethylhistidine N-methyltransferase